ncbi:MAG: inosine/xanthosine triphosphatase [Cyclobacteriaceae bacterium]|nr:inosine/xanthosine triphosphatase [Cyclobacteriaceae bacterium]
MKKIIIASKNPAKIKAVENAFTKVFPNEVFEYEGVSVPSDVPDQPVGEEETLLGAENRVNNAIKSYKGDYWVGLEGGVAHSDNQLEAFAWMVIRSSQMQGKGRTGSFFLPPKVAELVKEGMELGLADDEVFGQFNSKQKGGAVGLLTGNLLTRTSYYEHALILALIPFINEEHYL